MIISVITHPNSKRPRVEEDLTGQMHVYVSAPPLEGRANMVVIEALAEHFGVRKIAITLIIGHKSKMKKFEIKIK